MKKNDNNKLELPSLTPSKPASHVSPSPSSSPSDDRNDDSNKNAGGDGVTAGVFENELGRGITIVDAFEVNM